MVKPLIIVRLALFIILSGGSVAQTPIDQMRDLLDRGFYNSAAQLNGPTLIELYPQEPEAHYLYAFALYLTGNMSAARTEIDKALALTGQDTPSRYLHLNGLLQANEGDTENALQSLENAFLQDSSYRYAMDWARLAWQAGMYQEALQAYHEAANTELGQREPWPYLNRGRLFLFLGSYDEAIAAFTMAIEVFDANDPGNTRPSPAYVEAYYRLGEIYERLEDSEQAKNYYQAARSTDPTYAPAIEALNRLTVKDTSNP
ncbi:MAG: tetratricopeptide repeat protein [Trueperaceae bacterium]|nr:MAG: tetratricopeptide repeat protein [Trueperaceae bacterium]